MKKVSHIMVALLCVLSPLVQASVENVGTYNLILKNDLSTNSDIEGRVIIGGNLSGNSTDIGSHLLGDPLVDAVTVVGNITATDVKTQNGNIVYGGSANEDKLIINGTGSVIKAEQGLLQSRFDKIYQSVIDDSQYYQGLSATGTFDGTDNNKKLFNLGSNTDLVVFNINGNNTLNNSGSIDFNFKPTVPVVINVAGTGALDINVNFLNNLTIDQAPMVLWNFYDYTSINFGGGAWRGSVLAPYANITGSAASIEGGLAALSYSGNVELHNDLLAFERPKTNEVSAPSTLLLLLISGMWLLRRKRRS